jgi:sulfonate transport system substrate-binding protein
MISKGSAALIAGVLAAGLLAAACGSSSSSSSGSSSSSSASAVSAAALSKVTLHVGDQAGTGAEALLTAAGLIKKRPFKIDWADFSSGPPMLQAMGASAIDIGGVGDAPPVFAAAGGEKIAIAGALLGNPLGAAVVVPKGSPIKTLAELRGKKIAVSEGSSADYHLLAILTKAGLTPKDVTLDYLQPAQALAAFASGQVDAWDIWSPYIEQVVAQDGARVLVNGTPIGNTYSFEVVSRAALADPVKVAAIRDYIRVLNQAHAWSDTHQAAWAVLWAKATGLPQSVMVKAAADSTSNAVPINATVVSAEQSIANDFTAAGLIPGHVDFADYSVTTFNSVVGG